MTRPKLSDEMRRDQIIYARVRSAERQAIEEQARELNMPLGMLVRRILTQWMKDRAAQASKDTSGMR
jgi:hypothetical protein